MRRQGLVRKAHARTHACAAAPPTANFAARPPPALLQIWFPPLLYSPTHIATEGRQQLSRAAAAGGSAAPPASVAEISMRRIEFLCLLLEDGSVLPALCAAL